MNVANADAGEIRRKRAEAFGRDFGNGSGAAKRAGPLAKTLLIYKF